MSSFGSKRRHGRSSSRTRKSSRSPSRENKRSSSVTQSCHGRKRRKKNWVSSPCLSKISSVCQSPSCCFKSKSESNLRAPVKPQPVASSTLHSNTSASTASQQTTPSTKYTFKVRKRQLFPNLQQYQDFCEELQLHCNIYEKFRVRSEGKGFVVITEEKWTYIQQRWKFVTQRTQVSH